MEALLHALRHDPARQLKRKVAIAVITFVLGAALIGAAVQMVVLMDYMSQPRERIDE